MTESTLLIGVKPARLIGRTIKAVSISADRYCINFVTDGPEISFRACADCCSDSWIEHFEHDGIVGALVLGVDQKRVESSSGLMPTNYPEHQQEQDEVYFYEITTDKGSFAIEMRNSSNGYYGGWLDEVTQA